MSHSVLVTGVSKGIGRTIACQLAADGFNIGAHYHRDTTGAQEMLNAIAVNGGNGRLPSFGIADREQCRKALEHEIARHGTWCGVVSNTRIARDAVFPALSNNDWGVVIHTNLDSFYNIIQPRITPMVGSHQGEHIITLSSVSGIIGNCGQVDYSTAKTGIIGTTKALAIELAKYEITIDCITPGLIDTRMIEMEESAPKEIMSMIPMKRIGQAEEVVGLVSCLMFDVTGYVTRQVVSINGGMLRRAAQ